MSRIVDRYVIREIAKTCFGVTFVLLLILIGNQFARVLGRAAQERLTRDAVFELLWLSSIEYLTVLLPLALLLLHLGEDGGRLLAPHDADAGVGPHPQEPRFIGPAAHGIIAGPVRASYDQGELGHIRIRHGMHQLGSVLGDPSPELVEISQESAPASNNQENREGSQTCRKRNSHRYPNLGGRVYHISAVRGAKEIGPRGVQ